MVIAHNIIHAIFLIHIHTILVDIRNVSVSFLIRYSAEESPSVTSEFVISSPYYIRITLRIPCEFGKTKWSKFADYNVLSFGSLIERIRVSDWLSAYQQTLRLDTRTWFRPFRFTKLTRYIVRKTY